MSDKTSKLEQDIKAKDKQIEELNKKVESLQKAGTDVWEFGSIQKVKSLEEKVASLTQHNEKLNEKNQHLSVEVTTMKKTLEEERKESKETIKQKDAKIEELQQKLRDFAKNNNMGDIQAQNEKLQKDLDMLKDQLKKETKEKKELDENYKDLQKKLAADNPDAAKSGTQKPAAGADSVNFEQRYNELHENYDRLDKQSQKMKLRISELEKEKQKAFEDSQQKEKNEGQVIALSSSRIDDLTRQNQSLKKKISEHEAAAQTLQDEINRLKEKVQKERDNVKAEKTKIETYKNDVKQLHETLEKRENEIKEVRRISQKQTADFEKAITQLKKELAEKSQQDKEYLDMKAKFEDMKKQLLEKDKWIVELGRTSEKSSKAVGEVKGSLEKTYQVKIKTLQNQLSEKELEVKVLNQMIVSANKMVQVKTTEFNRLASKFHARSSLPFIREASDEFSVLDSKNSRVLSSANNLRLGLRPVRESAKRSSVGKKYSKLPNPGKSALHDSGDFLGQLDRSLLQSATKKKTLIDLRELAAEPVN